MVANNPLIGKQVGNYRILAEIKSGSFGSVYQGKHIIFEDDPVVAIKLLHSFLRSPQEHTEFIKEAQVLKKLQHPHILHILDAGFQDGIPYLVTEYAAGGSLRDRLIKSSGKLLPLDEITNILSQIGHALHYAHERHIIHRDLKPENILFDQAGKALLADFGIAILLASTHTGLVGASGTPPYMAPEQFEGFASAKSDQYSLGCIAYELVTGHRLFSIPNPTLEAYWFHHAKVEPMPPTRFHPQLPRYIEQAIFTALAKDRSRRYSDVLALANALLKSSQQWRDEGDTHLETKRYEEALAAYEQTIRLDPNDFYAYFSKGLALGNLKRYEEALAAYKQTTRLNPNYAYAYFGKKLAFGNLKSYELDLIVYEQAIHLNPNDASTYYGKGNILRKLKHYEEALRTYNQAIRLDPNFASAYYGKGNIFNDLKRYEEALTAYEQVIRLDPTHAYAYYGIGDALHYLKYDEEALTAFDQSIRLDPNFALAYYGKGIALRDLKRYEEALTAFDQAIRFDPNDAKSYNGKGTTLNNMGKTKEAEQAFEKAINLAITV